MTDDWEETSLVDLVLSTDPDHISPQDAFLWRTIGSWVQIQYRRYIFHRLSDVFADPTLKKKMEDRFEKHIHELTQDGIDLRLGDEPVIDPRTLREIEGGRK